jgi:hypothetical protein
MFIEHVVLLVVGLTGFALWPNLRGNQSKETSDTVEGIPCVLTQRRASRGNQVFITVELPCDARFEFTLRRQRFIDSLARTLSLVQEFRSGDAQFDAAVYIGADERGIDAWLTGDAEARRVFFDLLSRNPQEYTRVTTIGASRGRFTLRAVAKPPMFQKADDDLVQIIARSCLPALKSCLDRLGAFAAEHADPSVFYDPYAVPVRTLSGLTPGFFAVPWVWFLFSSLQPRRVELASYPFWDQDSLAAIATVMCILTLTAVALLWRSTRLHTVLLPLLLCGAFATLLSFPTLVRELNTDWDRSAPVRYATHVLKRYQTHGRGGVTYHVWLADWHSKTDHRELRVNESIYDQMQPEGTVTVTERAGYLGRPWVSDLSRDWNPPEDSH